MVFPCLSWVPLGYPPTCPSAYPSLLENHPTNCSRLITLIWHQWITTLRLSQFWMGYSMLFTILIHKIINPFWAVGCTNLHSLFPHVWIDYGMASLVAAGSQADLGGSDFSKSDLTGASLEGANLEDVSFENVPRLRPRGCHMPTCMASWTIKATTECRKRYGKLEQHQWVSLVCLEKCVCASVHLKKCTYI